MTPPSRLTVAVVLLAVLCAAPTVASAQTATVIDDEAVQNSGPPTTRQEILQRQRDEKLGALTPYVVSGAEDRVSRLETFRLPRRIFAKGFGGFRPVMGGMPSGSGFVFGGGYIAGYNHELIQFTANARYSTRGYTTFDTGVIFPTPARRLPVQAHVKAEVRDLKSLRYFGLGPASSASGRSTYGLEDRSIEAGVTATASRFVEMGATARWMNAEVGPGAAGASLEERFDPFQTPGFGTKTDYLVYGWHLVVHLRDAHVIPSAGVPVHLRSDNGPEFTATLVRGWLETLGVQPLFIEPGSPWENGYVESFNGKLRDELLDREIVYTLTEAQILIERWRQQYNTVRPHSALGYRPPAPVTVIPAACRSLEMSPTLS